MDEQRMKECKERAMHLCAVLRSQGFEHYVVDDPPFGWAIIDPDGNYCFRSSDLVALKEYLTERGLLP
jgi:hypothetical protein